MKYGQAIETNGKKPKWLTSDCNAHNMQWKSTNDTDNCWTRSTHSNYTKSDWERHLRFISFPVQHYIYKALDLGFIPWMGGDEKPKDWDGGHVLWKSPLQVGPAPTEIDGWEHSTKHGNNLVIGYRDKRVRLNTLEDIYDHIADGICYTDCDIDAALKCLKEAIDYINQKKKEDDDELLKEFAEKTNSTVLIANRDLVLKAIKFGQAH